MSTIRWETWPTEWESLLVGLAQRALRLGTAQALVLQYSEHRLIVLINAPAQA